MRLDPRNPHPFPLPGRHVDLRTADLLREVAAVASGAAPAVLVATGHDPKGGPGSVPFQVAGAVILSAEDFARLRLPGPPDASPDASRRLDDTLDTLTHGG